MIGNSWVAWFILLGVICAILVLIQLKVSKMKNRFWGLIIPFILILDNIISITKNGIGENNQMPMSIYIILSMIFPVILLILYGVERRKKRLIK